MFAPGAPKKSRKSDSFAIATQTHYAVDDQQLYCIEDLEEFSSEETSYQRKTYELLCEVGVDPIWLSAKDALAVVPNDPHFYVIPIFKGRVFDHLESVRCKVLGTSLIRYCLKQNQPIPKKPHPVYSIHFNTVKVCFTGLSRERRDYLSKLVRYMNGAAEGNLLPSVTHLIADKGDYSSDKYRAAKTKRIPIMKENWVEDAWNDSLQTIRNFYLKEINIERYILPLFNKMVICTTGITGQERNDVLRLIESNGGKSPGEMKRGECTHLITSSTTGDKYRKAKQWGEIHIVTTRWLRKCIEQGYIQDESKFNPDATPLPCKISTQRPGGAAPKDLDVSSIYGPLKHTLNSQILVDHNASKNREKVGLSSITHANMPRTQSRRHVDVKKSGDSTCLDSLFETELKGDFDFFEGCSIFIAGIDKGRQERINRILDRCGATRVNYIEIATHVIVTRVKESERTLLIEAQQKGIAVLQPEWLVMCIKDRDLICTEEYFWDNDETVCRNSTIAVSVVGPSRQTMDSSHSHEINVLTTVTDQYYAEPGPGSHSSIGPHIFLDHTFRLHLLEPDLISQLQTAIEENGGCTIEEDQDIITDYLVAPQIEYGSVPDVKLDKFKHLVTENFIRHCIASRQIFDSQKRPLFKPLPAVSGSQIFQDVVFGFVAIGDIDKLTFCHLVKDFGGTVEASIVTRPRDNIKPCTHIIAGAEISKIAEFRRKLPYLKIMDPSWIIDCVINDRKLAEGKYLFKEIAYKNYQGRSDDFWVSAPLERNQNDQISGSLETPRAVITPFEQLDNIVFNDNDIHECDSNISSVVVERRRTRNSMDTRFNPRLQLDEVSQVLKEMPSPIPTDPNNSINTFSITRVGKMLSEAAIKTGKPPAEPHRAVTDPVLATTPRCAKGNFYRMSPKKYNPAIQTSELTDKDPSKNDINQESILSSRLMQRQIDYLSKINNIGNSSTVNSGNKRKRVHEMIKDSPLTPPVKRNISLIEPPVDWQTERERVTIEDNINVYTPKESIINENNQRVICYADDEDSNHISLEPPAANFPQKLLNKQPTITISDEMKTTPLLPSYKKTNNFESCTEDNIIEGREKQPDKVFLFTGIQNNKDTYEEIVVKLGGKIAPNSSLSDVTHLVCGKLVRGTKLMGCIAAGKWILTEQYLLECAAAEKFINEEPFEWGNPQVILRNTLNGLEKQIATAGIRWRQDLALHQKKGVFSGWRVLLYAVKEKASSVVPLLEAGDAQVVVRENLRISIAQFAPTHTIVIKSVEWNRTELNSVVTAGSKVYTLEFIANLLLLNEIKEEDSYHMDYKLYLRQKSFG